MSLTCTAPGVRLRPYQEAAVAAVLNYVESRGAPGAPLIVLPTGAGKSLTMAALIAAWREQRPGGRALILAHRQELIQQNVKAMATGLPLEDIGIYSAGLGRKDVDTPILVASIQSIARKPEDVGAFDLILVDEAHLVPRADDTMYASFIKAARRLNPNVVIVGLTATPWRMDSGLLHRGPGTLFTDVVFEVSVSELVSAGYLCPLVARGTDTRLSVAEVGTRGGEFIPGQLERAVDRDVVTAAVVNELLVRGADRRWWLAFCAGIAHAEHVAAALRAQNVAAAAVHGEISDRERAARLADFRDGRLRALTTVDLLTTGFDQPSIDLIALLRPTQSPGLYVQMVGRGLRLHPSKTDCLVLDFASNVSRHGPIDEIVVTDEAAREGDGAPPIKECPGCRRLLSAGVKSCPECKHVFPAGRAGEDAITGQPSDLAVMSSVVWVDLDPVHGVRHELHHKTGKPVSLRVQYFGAGRQLLATEWQCFEHDAAYARYRAAEWWRQRDPMGGSVPRTAAEALRRVDELRRPSAIAIRPDGSFMRVVAIRLASAFSMRGAL